MSLYPTIKNLTLYASIVLILLGLVLPVTRGPSPGWDLGMIIAGLVLSLVSLILAIIVTNLKLENVDIDSLIFHNSLTYIVIIGNVFLLGYLLQPLPQLIESIIVDIGIIMGLFIILMYLWNFLRLKLGFLDVDLDIDFAHASDKEKIPPFLITTLVLGGIFSLLYILFKIIYLFVGYAITCIVFVVVIAVFTFTISFTLYYLRKGKSGA